MWLVALSPLIGLFAEALAHIVLVRIVKRVLSALAMGIVVGAVICAVCVANGLKTSPALEPIDATFTALSVAISFLALTFCLWAVINLNTTAIRIRVLREIWDAPNRRLPLSELAASYNTDAIVATRIRRLQERGHIKCEDGVVTLGSRTLPTIAGLIDITRRLIIPAQRGR